MTVCWPAPAEKYFRCWVTEAREKEVSREILVKALEMYHPKDLEDVISRLRKNSTLQERTCGASYRIESKVPVEHPLNA